MAKDILDNWDVVDRLQGGQLLCNFISTADENPIPEPSQPLDFQVLVATLFDLKHLAETQTEAIKVLTNRVSNLDRTSVSADLTTSLDGDISATSSSSFFSPLTPSGRRRRCPEPPKSTNNNNDLRRTILTGKRNLNADSPSFFPQKQRKFSDDVFLDAALLPSNSESYALSSTTTITSEASLGAFSSSTSVQAVAVVALPGASTTALPGALSAALPGALTAALRLRRFPALRLRLFPARRRQGFQVLRRRLTALQLRLFPALRRRFPTHRLQRFLELRR